MKCTVALMLAAVAAVTPGSLARGQTALPSPFVTTAIPASQLPAKRVTISVKNAPIREAFRQLKEQTNFFFTLGEFHPDNNPSGMEPGMIGSPRTAATPRKPAVYPEDDQLVTLDVKDASFWQTVQQLLAQTKSFSASTGVAAWSMSDSGSDQPPHYAGRIQVAGPFLILALRIDHQADFRYAPALAEEFYLYLQVLEGPDTKIAQYTTAFIPTKAVDEKGNSLIPTRPISAQNNSFFPRQENVTIALHRPPNAGRTISVLEGVITFSVISKTESIEVPIPGSIEKQYGDIKATFSVSPGGRGGVGGRSPAARSTSATGPAAASAYTLIADYERPSTMSDDEWKKWDGLFNTSIPRLTDANGKVWGSGTSAASQPNHRTITQTATRSGSNDAGPAAKAVFTVALQAQPISIPFHFENLPLP